MAIEDILHALEEQADAEIETLRSESAAHAAHVVAEAELDAERIRQDFAELAERTARTQATRKVNSTRMETRRGVLRARDEGVESIFAEAARRITEVRDSAGYDVLFARLFAEAVAGLSGEVVVRVVPDDKDRALAALKSTEVQATVRTDLEGAGGVVIMTPDERIIRRNTLEERLERAKEITRSEVARTLFE